METQVTQFSLASEQDVKKKRGRPRKNNVTNGNNMLSLPLSTPSILSHDIEPKRGRGRPRGSGKKRIVNPSISGYQTETAGGSFTPYVMNVNTGEDVVGRILAFSRNVVRATVCILSVTGVVSSVLIRKSDSSNDETLRREGCYAILSLSGSYTYVDGDIKGMSNILLAEPDGKVFGGAVEGSLIAAAPIQLIVASFKQTMTMSKKIKRNHSAGSSAAVTTTIDKDLNRVPLKAPETIRDSNPSFSSPTSGLMPTITNRVSENVIPANQNTQTATMNGVGLDSHTLQQPITDSTQNIVADDNVVV